MPGRWWAPNEVSSGGSDAGEAHVQRRLGRGCVQRFEVTHTHSEYSQCITQDAVF